MARLLPVIVSAYALFGQWNAQAQTLEEIIDATREREASIRTAQITWNETRVMTAALLTKLGALPGSHDIRTPPYPASLLISGRKLRCETRLPQHQGDGFSSHEMLVRGFDGNVDWYFGNEPPKGVIRASAEFSDIQVVTISPWMLYVRPMHPEIFNLSADTFAVETPQTVLNERPCVVVRERAGVHGHVRRRFWLDRQRQYVVVRLISEFDGRVSAQVNIDYREHPELGWIPSRWDTAMYGKDSVLHDATDATLTDAQFNRDIEASHFSADFPVGTKVFDHRQDGRAFYALGNGQLRPFTNDDDRGKWRLPVPGWMIAAMAFFGLTVLLLWRRSRLQSG